VGELFHLFFTVKNFTGNMKNLILSSMQYRIFFNPLPLPGNGDQAKTILSPLGLNLDW